MAKFCQLWLTTANTVEAGEIVKVLLEKKLIACARQFPVGSDFRWQGKIEHTNEVLLVMESRSALFDKVEAEVKKLHSYETFVLEAVPVSHVSKAASKWLEGELK